MILLIESNAFGGIFSYVSPNDSELMVWEQLYEGADTGLKW